MTVQQLIEELEKMQPNKTVLCQVVAEDGSAWNMSFEINDVPRSDWIVALTVSHPELKTLPKTIAESEGGR